MDKCVDIWSPKQWDALCRKKFTVQISRENDSENAEDDRVLAYSL